MFAGDVHSSGSEPDNRKRFRFPRCIPTSRANATLPGGPGFFLVQRALAAPTAGKGYLAQSSTSPAKLSLTLLFACVFSRGGSRAWTFRVAFRFCRLAVLSLPQAARTVGGRSIGLSTQRTGGLRHCGQYTVRCSPGQDKTEPSRLVGASGEEGGRALISTPVPQTLSLCSHHDLSCSGLPGQLQDKSSTAVRGRATVCEPYPFEALVWREAGRAISCRIHRIPESAPVHASWQAVSHSRCPRGAGIPVRWRWRRAGLFANPQSVSQQNPKRYTHTRTHTRTHLLSRRARAFRHCNCTLPCACTLAPRGLAFLPCPFRAGPSSQHTAAHKASNHSLCIITKQREEQRQHQQQTKPPPPPPFLPARSLPRCSCRAAPTLRPARVVSSLSSGVAHRRQPAPVCQTRPPPLPLARATPCKSANVRLQQRSRRLPPPAGPTALCFWVSALTSTPPRLPKSQSPSTLCRAGPSVAPALAGPSCHTSPPKPIASSTCSAHRCILAGPLPSSCIAFFLDDRVRLRLKCCRAANMAYPRPA